MKNSEATLVTKWKTKDGEVPIVEMEPSHLVKAIHIMERKLRPFKKIKNVHTALKEELAIRKEKARQKAVEDMEELKEGDIIMVGTMEEVAEDLKKNEVIYQRLIKEGKLMRIEFGDEEIQTVASE